MQTTTEMLSILNNLRDQLGQKPIKTWKASRAALVGAIEVANAKLQPEEDRNHIAEVAAEAAREETKPLTGAELARRAGIDPKVFRAKMRRHRSEITGMTDPDAIIAALTKDHRKKGE
jgi:hypothetical protein